MNLFRDARAFVSNTDLQESVVSTDSNFYHSICFSEVASVDEQVLQNTLNIEGITYSLERISRRIYLYVFAFQLLVGRKAFYRFFDDGKNRFS